jgi:hypothetical protein
MLKTTVILATLFAISLPSHAESLNWNKYRGSYVSVDTEEETYSPDGFMLSSTRMINDNIFGMIQYTAITDDAIIDGIETTSDTRYFDGAIGYKHTYKESTDFYGTFGFRSYQNDFMALANDQSKNDIGYATTIGARHLIANKFEIHLNTTRVVFDGDGRWEHLFGLAFHQNRNLSWEVSFVKSDYADKLIVGGSFGF